MRAMRISQIMAASLLVAAASCTVVDADLFSPIPDGYQGPSTGGGNTTSDSQGTGASGAGDLPCDVAGVLETYCDTCHAVGTPPLLRSRADFMQASSDPNANLGQASVMRMQDAASPMPPDGVPPAADTQIVADWVAAGMPAGDCGNGAGGAGPNPYDADPICSSGRTWNNGTDGGTSMKPGQACNACHAMENKVIYAFAGTVYQTAHEPDDCLGVRDEFAAEVEFTDANGAVITAATNQSGNFTVNQGNVAFPVTVRVLKDGNSLAMVAPLAAGDGDCNTCHNQDGANGAPGRIILPF